MASHTNETVRRTRDDPRRTMLENGCSERVAEVVGASQVRLARRASASTRPAVVSDEEVADELPAGADYLPCAELRPQVLAGTGAFHDGRSVRQHPSDRPVVVVRHEDEADHLRELGECVLV